MKQFSLFLQAYFQGSVQEKGAFLTPLLFYGVCLSLYCFIIPQDLGDFTPFILTSFLLAFVVIVIRLSTLFLDDYRSGFLETLIAHNLSLPAYASATLVGFWLTQCLPITLITLTLTAFMGLDLSVLIILGAGQSLCLLNLCLVGGLVGALCLESQGRSALLGALILPFCLPSLIISLELIQQPSGFWTYLGLLFGLLLISSGISLVASPYGLRLLVR